MKSALEMHDAFGHKTRLIDRKALFIQGRRQLACIVGLLHLDRPMPLAVGVLVWDNRYKIWEGQN